MAGSVWRPDRLLHTPGPPLDAPKPAIFIKANKTPTRVYLAREKGACGTIQKSPEARSVGGGRRDQGCVEKKKMRRLFHFYSAPAGSGCVAGSLGDVAWETDKRTGWEREALVGGRWQMIPSGCCLLILGQIIPPPGQALAWRGPEVRNWATIGSERCRATGVLGEGLEKRKKKNHNPTQEILVRPHGKGPGWEQPHRPG